MIFHVLSKKHKKQYLINQLIVVIALIICLFISWEVTGITLPTSVDKLTASAGFVTSGGILLLAILNRAGVLFKIRSVGFLIMFILFATIGIVLDVLMWTTGLMTAVLLLDDIVMKPYWSSIWWNEYQDVAMRTHRTVS